MTRIAALALLLLFAACPPPAPGASTLPRDPGAGSGPEPGEPPSTTARIAWTRVTTAADLPAAPAPGSYHLHLIDVGTGLAILVQGADFALLYDAGTNDREEKPLRVLAYLAAVLGPSGDELCVEPGAPAPTARRALDHVVLSHPHLDHASALDLVLHCYDVARVWDSGRIHDTVFYREFLAAVSTSKGSYHTAGEVPADRQVAVKGLTITIPTWQRFSEGDRVLLGEGAAFTFLHADAKHHHSPNRNSIVISVELAGKRVLLVGDAESGPRKDPSYPAGEIEEFLIDHHAAAIRSDILQVGHHGSMTSSRRAFLEAVRPGLALVSAGPKKYGTKTLPDREVLDELQRVGATILRTDEHDEACPIGGRIGGDRGPGGCDTWVITIGP